MNKILLVTTVPETLFSILKGQPKFLSNYYDVSIVTGAGVHLSMVKNFEGVDVKCINMHRGINPIKDIFSIFNMVIFLLKNKPLIIHSYTPKAGFVAMIAGWICRVPVRVHTFTGLIFPTSKGFKKKLLIFVDRLICFCSTHIVPEGAGVKRDLENYKITKKTLKVIGSGNIAGVDTEYFSINAEGVFQAAEVMRRNLKISPHKKVFCFVGRLNRDKGVNELYDAFLSLDDEAHLIVVGALDATLPIAHHIYNLMLKHPRIHVLGYLEDIRPALLLSDFLILPSYREGFPNVVLQAGAMSLPVIATNINGCNEVIEAGKNGWLVNPRDVNELARAMKVAVGINNDLYLQMGDFARRKIKENFERIDHWKRMVEFYQGLINEAKKGGGV